MDFVEDTRVGSLFRIKTQEFREIRNTIKKEANEAHL